MNDTSLSVVRLRSSAYLFILLFLLSTLDAPLAQQAEKPSEITSQKKRPTTSEQAEWASRISAIRDFMRLKMYNPNTGNFIRRTDVPMMNQNSDAWGITIVLDAYSYLVEQGLMKPAEMKQYFTASTKLYEQTNNGRGARIIVRQGPKIYVGGDDELQWIAALAHAYRATKDEDYLLQARLAFNSLIELGFWKQNPRGWAWNSNDQRPMGVSTSYGALAAARLYEATGDSVYKLWAEVALRALRQKQISFIPRDKLVTVQAQLLLYRLTKNKLFLTQAAGLINEALRELDDVLEGKAKGEINPTDVGDLAEGLYEYAQATRKIAYSRRADRLIEYFFRGRDKEDIRNNGFYSRYEITGDPAKNWNAVPVTEGDYIGIPLSAIYLPEVAEMLKLAAIRYKVSGL